MGLCVCVRVCVRARVSACRCVCLCGGGGGGGGEAGGGILEGRTCRWWNSASSSVCDLAAPTLAPAATVSRAPPATWSARTSAGSVSAERSEPCAYVCVCALARARASEHVRVCAALLARARASAHVSLCACVSALRACVIVIGSAPPCSRYEEKAAEGPQMASCRGATNNMIPAAPGREVMTRPCSSRLGAPWPDRPHGLYDCIANSSLASSSFRLVSAAAFRCFASCPA
jgi:hypothetical protein